MIDKDTGRPRGFGFVTFDSEAAVDATLAGDLQILGKPIEVKKAQPRGNMREEENESSDAVYEAVVAEAKNSETATAVSMATTAISKAKLTRTNKAKT